MEDYKKQLEILLKQKFKSDASGHDIYHLQRVYNLALHIQEKEGGDRLVIGIAAFLHDVHRLMSLETGKFVHPVDSAPVIKELLQAVNFPKDKVQQVLHCVEFHEEYTFSKKGKTVTDIETLILQDADNLDAIGAIGIGRTFAYGGAHNATLWIPEIPIDSKSSFDEWVDDPSTVHHFYHKLLRLHQSINTATGKKIGAQRHKYTEAFLERFLKEWKGEA